jgi:uncharacterized protein YndB with AHSA1/START domain
VAIKIDDLVVRRVFNCPKRTLFDAWSQPSVMSKWLFARREDFCESTVTNSFSVGGSYSIIMHMPNSDVKLFGEYTDINRYSLIAFTWSSPAISNSNVRLEFKELSPNRTEFTLTHSLFPSEEVRAEHGAGWNACLDNLEERVLSLSL